MEEDCSVFTGTHGRSMLASLAKGEFSRNFAGVVVGRGGMAVCHSDARSPLIFVGVETWFGQRPVDTRGAET
jgi:hypothetical protein